ncbi:hypothetical protein AKJ61_04720 [candidate division MSBL1 archaeon SCGC-AAA259B11]|uniref:Uncharacterized protein n=1 Tax=candidate division MSBL1 archaeon SCGC-AAA259B11 TaxID=1698260 RepID=A0A133U2X2_9EURY|nr:hypothetical protein AKJ61_04720 [candidate division MSBL1 archaeon SCGC-AAA259B11]
MRILKFSLTLISWRLSQVSAIWVAKPKIHLRRRNNPTEQFWSEENISVTDIAKISFQLKISKNLFGLYI